MNVGISDRYLDKHYGQFEGLFDYVEYQIYNKRDIDKCSMKNGRCLAHLPSPLSIDFLELVTEI